MVREVCEERGDESVFAELNLRAGKNMTPLALTFPNGHHATAMCVHAQHQLAEAFSLLGVRLSRPVLVLVGGAAGLEAHRAALVKNILRLVAETAESLEAAIIDGGTQSGIIALIGEIHAEWKFNFPLVGVAVEAMVRWPGNANTAARAELDPHHPSFLLVPGSKWGDESQWLSESAHTLAQTLPSLTLLINGGEISRQDVKLSVLAKRPVLVVADTGRLADELAQSSPSSLLHIASAADLNALSSKLQALLTRS